MDSRALSYSRAFVALGREMHFGRAAASLGLSQSALSRQIAELEARVGFALVHRTTRQVKLTAAGSRLWQGVADGLAQIDQALAQAREFARGNQGVIRIGYTRVSMICRGGVAIQSLRKEFPDIVIEMHELGTNAQVDALLADRIDIGLLHPPIAQAELKLDRLGDEALVIVAAPTHRLAARDALALAELAGDAMILYPREVGPKLFDEIIATCSVAGFTPEIVQHCTSWETAVDLAVHGLGIAWAPSVFAERRSADVAVLAVTDVLPSLPCAIATVRGRREASTRTLIDRIVAHARAGSP